MKKFISGAVTGAILAGTVAFAASYVAEPASFKVMVNGQEFNSDPPAMVINGSTYLPLRAMGNALGVPVEWNDELRQAEVGTTPQDFGSNYSRKNPAPIGEAQWVTVDSFTTGKYTLGIKVTEIIRGEEAYEMLKEENSFNSEPKEGYEYILAKISVTAESTDEDKSISITNYSFEPYTGNNERYDQSWLVAPDELSTEIYEGGNAEGYTVFQVKKDDSNPKIAYGLKYDGSGGVWFALYE